MVPGLGSLTRAPDDLIRPFQIENMGVRGRLVRLGPALNEILDRHAYPDLVSRLLAEAVALSCALAGALKFDGVFTLQTKGDGPISTLLADFKSPGSLRGYAQFDAEAVRNLDPTVMPSIPRLLGAGYIAFTVDQGPDTERYQGIVALEGFSLADCAHNYFRESEQIETAIVLAGGRESDDGPWRGGAIMLQRLPEGDPSLLARGVEFERDEVSEDDWRRLVVLLASTQASELIDPNLTGDELLYRLFHEDGVRIFEPTQLQPGCRCSQQRAERILQQLPRTELDDLAVAEQLIVTCEFCNASYTFPLEQFSLPG
ncbi:MAG: Hsp33 family molecular chaperone HslO [Alphaproteobacteria bacterium]|nr:Hsp33 family molecular chaperone HslO [Alphaproteobacteria bacterium]